GVALADIGVIHDERAALVQDLQIAVTGAADRNAVVASRGLNPDILKTRLPSDPAIGDAIQRDAAGDAQIFGPGYLAQPAGARDQHVFGIVLNPPGKILPMPHRGTAVPAPAIDDVGLLDFILQCRTIQLPLARSSRCLTWLGLP